MIKHHPKYELIQSFVKGDLPVSLSAGIAIHADMCSTCQQKIVQLTEQAAEVSFEEDLLDKLMVDSQGQDITLMDFDQMIDGLFNLPLIWIALFNFVFWQTVRRKN